MQFLRENNLFSKSSTASVSGVLHYYPFGMLMPNRSFSAIDDYRFGFNGKLRDDDLKGDGDSYDFGERVYDSRLGRWLSVDPYKFKFPALSPYNFSSNAPMLFIDPKGQDNIVYLVILPSAYNKITPSDAKAIVDQANQNFKNLGLDTRVVLFTGKNFNAENMDKNDAVAVMGSAIDVKKYVNENIDKSYIFSKDWGTLDEPEESNGKFIGLNSDAFDHWSKEVKSTLAKANAFSISHGAGHLAAPREHHGWAQIMNEGSVIAAHINTENGGYTGYISEEGHQINVPKDGTRIKNIDELIGLSGNETYLEKMRKLFQNGEKSHPAVDNYILNESVNKVIKSLPDVFKSGATDFLKNTNKGLAKPVK